MSITEDARSLAARTRAAQGLPERVTDPGVLAKVATILASGEGNADPHHRAGVTNTITTTTTSARKSRYPDGT